MKPSNVKYVALGVVLILLVGALGGAVLILGDKNTSNSSQPVDRVPVFGNANNDYEISNSDIDTLNYIIDNNIADWKENYPYADANQDGKIDSEDITAVQKYLNKEEMKLYYINYFGVVAYVNYPIVSSLDELKTVVDGVIPMDFTVACGLWDQVVGVNTDGTIHHDSQIYPGVDDLKRIGNYREYTAEQVLASGANLVLGWTSAGAVDYFSTWEDIDTVQKEVSVVSVASSGTDICQGALTLHTLLNVEGDNIIEYVNFCDKCFKIVNDKLETTDKLTVIAAPAYQRNATANTTWVYLDSFVPAQAIWSVVDNKFAGEAGSQKTGCDAEWWLTSGTGPIVAMTYYSLYAARDANQNFTQNYEEYARIAVEKNLGNTEAYANHQIYLTDWSIMSLSGTAPGVYLLASMIYPDLFDQDDAIDEMDYFMDHFSYRTEKMYYLGDITSEPQ